MEQYLVLKALHIISMIAWMAGLLYLPRLYVYHAGATPGSEASEMLKVMESKLLRYITTPAMIATFVFGIWMGKVGGLFEPGAAGKWFHLKMGLVLVLAGFHGMLAKWRKDFAADRNQKSAKFFRYANEFPTLIMIAIVFLVILKAPY